MLFDLFFSAIQAYNQIGMFTGALICLGIGGFILGNSLYWRVHAVRVTGTVVGVLPKGNVYFPVYQYTGPDDRSHVAKADYGSSSVSGKDTGGEVDLLVSAHDPAVARERNNYLFDIIGLAFFAPGLWLGYIAVTAFPFTPMTWIVGAALSIYAGERLYRVVKLIRTKLSISGWQQHNGTIDLSKVQRIESLAVDPAGPKTQGSQMTANRKVMIPLLAIFAIAFAAAGSYQALTTYRLENLGMRTDGEIVRFVAESNSNHGGSTYYPVVRFRTTDNEAIEFKDRIGSNPPTRHTGDKVRVLYLAATPGQSIIDRGSVINWAIPALLLVVAAFAAWLTVKLQRAEIVDAAA